VVPPELPTLDFRRWTALWSRLGARGSGREVFQQLSAAYAEPSRAYHTAEHVQACLAEFDQCRELARHPDEVEAALWFHDAVYVPGAADNEEQSARLAESELKSHGVMAEVTQRVTELVLATQHLSPPKDPDARLLCDIDLAILGRKPVVFDCFESQIRREYQWVPESRYRRSRSAVLARILERPSIYYTRRFAERYEVQARQNLKRSLAALSN
jgi:predicted metal-dependent HD superfamily phosphohydrolase